MSITELPSIVQIPSPNYSSRNGATVRLVVVHDCEGNADGAASWFAQKRSEVSAQIIYDPKKFLAYQCVPMGMKAWACCNANSYSDNLELGGFTKQGFSDAELTVSAAITAWLLKRRGLPCRWAENGEGQGVCSHWDLGAMGGGHFDITTDRAVWLAFFAKVQAAYSAFGDNAPPWGLEGMPQPGTCALPPAMPAGFTPCSHPRKDAGAVASHGTRSGYPIGSYGDIQYRLNEAGYSPKLDVDNIDGAATSAAISKFQQAKGLYIDGVVGVNTWAKLSAYAA